MTPAQPGCIEVSEDEIIKAINSFHVGSAGGPDGLKPQYLKDMIGRDTDISRQILLPDLVFFTELVLNGNTPVSILWSQSDCFREERG